MRLFSLSYFLPAFGGSLLSNNHSETMSGVTEALDVLLTFFLPDATHNTGVEILIRRGNTNTPGAPARADSSALARII